MHPWIPSDAAGQRRDRVSTGQRSNAHFFYPREASAGVPASSGQLAGRSVPSAPDLGAAPHRHARGAATPGSAAPGTQRRPSTGVGVRYHATYHHEHDDEQAVAKLLQGSEAAAAAAEEPSSSAAPNGGAAKGATPRRAVPIHLRPTTGDVRRLIGASPEPAPSGGHRYAGPDSAPAPYAGGPGNAPWGGGPGAGGRALEFTPAANDAPRTTGRASGSCNPAATATAATAAAAAAAAAAAGGAIVASHHPAATFAGLQSSRLHTARSVGSIVHASPSPYASDRHSFEERRALGISEGRAGTGHLPYERHRTSEPVAAGTAGRPSVSSSSTVPLAAQHESKRNPILSEASARSPTRPSARRHHRPSSAAASNHLDSALLPDQVYSPPHGRTALVPPGTQPGTALPLGNDPARRGDRADDPLRHSKRHIAAPSACPPVSLDHPQGERHVSVAPGVQRSRRRSL